MACGSAMCIVSNGPIPSEYVHIGSHSRCRCDNILQDPILVETKTANGAFAPVLTRPVNRLYRIHQGAYARLPPQRTIIALVGTTTSVTLHAPITPVNTKK